MEIGPEQDPIDVPVPLHPGQVPALPVIPAPEPAVPNPVPGAARYRPRMQPVITALQWTGSNLPAIRALVGEDRAALFRGGPALLVVTLGDRVIGRGDWVMLFDTGHVAVCSAETFTRDYEQAPDGQQVTAGVTQHEHP